MKTQPHNKIVLQHHCGLWWCWQDEPYKDKLIAVAGTVERCLIEAERYRSAKEQEKR